MAGPSTLKTLKSPPLSPPPSSMKLKTLLRTLISSHMYRVARALARAKPVLIRFMEFPLRKRAGKSGEQKKLFFGSFRLHYNWCSTHSGSCVHHGSSWGSEFEKTKRVGSDCEEMQPECVNSKLVKYLQWLEKKGAGEEEEGEDDGMEIDKLADLFIANCHEKFRLEKQESYRRFQEMMARSV